MIDMTWKIMKKVDLILKKRASDLKCLMVVENFKLLTSFLKNSV